MLKSIRLFFVLLLILTITLSLDTLSPIPPGPMGPYLNGIFPTTTPGAGGAWELEDPMPDLTIPSPVRILPLTGTSDLLVLSKVGEVWRVSLETQSKELILDIKDRSFKKGEAGTVGIALHPLFGDASAPDKQKLFLFYRAKPDPDVWSELGFNRLSKFTWDPASENFDPNSEEILIQQFDRHTWHNGGGMFFGPDGFLYLSLGDEGSNQEEHPEYQIASTQKLTGGLFSGVIRIDIDNDPTRSHPIRRQPIVNATPPDGWWNTYSQGYSIPDDNPWLSPDSSRLEEFYAIGIRSPFSMNFDQETQQIWLADVGSNKREEINLVEKGDNLQWPYMEGTVKSDLHQKPELLIGQEKRIYFEYDRTFGSCIIGGAVYRGSAFPNLNGKYLYADYIQGKLLAINNTGNNLEPEILLSNLDGQQVALPKESGITGIFPLEDGQILLTLMGQEINTPGKIFRLKAKTYVPDPPAKLSELGVFTDLNTLTTIPGIIPYGVNASLWSDRAVKKRWIAIPNDGGFDSLEEQITFRSRKEWTFPEGTVFIKQFDLPITTDPTGETIPLETRFFIVGKNGIGYGLTYKWNEEGTEAVLLSGGASADFDIYEDGEFAFMQTWDYPSRDQCISCHTDNAGYILGVKTHQLNGELYYPELGRSLNQLAYLNEINVFHRDIGGVDDYPRAYAIEDESVDLEIRIRSYMDSNCSSCHRENGILTLDQNLRFNVPTNLMNIINFPTQSEASLDRLIVKPGDHASSELWIRDASSGNDRMPPLGRNLVDQVYVNALAEWIGTLTEDAGSIDELLLYPNPSDGVFSIRISDDWIPPFRIEIREMSGKTVFQEISELSSAFIDLNNQPAGIYIVEIFSNEKHEVKKFVLH